MEICNGIFHLALDPPPPPALMELISIHFLPHSFAIESYLYETYSKLGLSQKCHF